MAEDLLESFLIAADEELENIGKEEHFSLKDTDIFTNEKNSPKKIAESGVSSVIHRGDTDSSDDESNRNSEENRYNSYGREIKHLLGSSSSTSYNKTKPKSTWKQKVSFSSNSKESLLEKGTNGLILNKMKSDIYTDPIFGMRIINPLVSSAVLQERMVGRDAVPFARINNYLQLNDKDKDWVIAGVVVNKSAVRTSQKGSQYLIWTLSDLKDDIKTISLFLFAGAYKNLWKTTVGTVIGVLNPNVLDKKSGSKDEASLSIDNPQKVMVLGQSKDFGICKSMKKNGEQCTSIVNLNRCEFCVYHIKQEYQKCSRRSELQSNFTGKGLIALRNKVLGKNEVFYAGKSYTAIPAKKNRKLEQKDENRLKSLSGMGITVNLNKKSLSKNKNVTKKQNAARLDVSQAQRLKDMELLKRLGGTTGIESKNAFSGEHSTEVTLEESKKNAIKVINKLKAKNSETPVNKRSQYDLKSDLICNIDNKTEFNSKLSETITLDESKSNALNVIAKLKVKNSQNQISDLYPKDDKQLENPVINNITDDEIDLEYDIDLNIHDSSREHLKKKTQNSLNDDILSQLVSPITKKNMKITGTPNCVASSSKVMNDDSTKQSKIATCQVKNLNKPQLNSTDFPVLSGYGSGNMIDLSQPIIPKRIERAKLNAIKFIQKNGPLKKEDPNKVKGSAKKRLVENTEDIENPAKKSKLQESEFISERFKKMMAATSKHQDLLESKDEEEQIKYFKKLEMKENMEEKMASTYKVACKAVKCLKCKYTSFSASEMCKNEKHPLKVFDAMKRFFKCGHCGNRTVSLDIIPTVLCKNCGSGNWERTGMMKEKVIGVTHSLSIRGGEQKFANSVVTDANINLLVPDE